MTFSIFRDQPFAARLRLMPGSLGTGSRVGAGRMLVNPIPAALFMNRHRPTA